MDADLKEILTSQNEIINNLINKKAKPKTKSLIKNIKPKLSIENFIEDIEILSPTKLLNNKLPVYYALTILHNLESYEVKNRPLVLADIQKKHYYFYSEDKWVENSRHFFQLIRNKIFKLVVAELIRRKEQTNCNEETCLCMSYFFDVEKYPNEKLLEKIMIELAKIMPSMDYDSE